MLRVEIGDEERAVDKALVERGLRFCAETLAEEVVDFGKNRCWDEKPTRFPFDQCAGRRRCEGPR